MSKSLLFASKGVHQAFIEINEERTEAADATAVALVWRSAFPPRQFLVDRPFLFIVYDLKQETSLFAGKVVDQSIL